MPTRAPGPACSFPPPAAPREPGWAFTPSPCSSLSHYSFWPGSSLGGFFCAPQLALGALGKVSCPQAMQHGGCSCAEAGVGEGQSQQGCSLAWLGPGCLAARCQGRNAPGMSLNV